MLFLRKFFAGIFSLIAISLFLPFFMAFLPLRTYLSPSFLNDTFLPESYGHLNLFIQIGEEMAPQGGGKPQDFEKTVEKFFPKERYLVLTRALLSEAVESLKQYVPGPPFKLSFVKTKKAAFEEIKKYAANFPVCKPGEKPESDICMPAGLNAVSQKAFKDQFIQGITQWIDAGIPNNAILKESEKFPWVRYLAFAENNRTQIVWGMAGIVIALLAVMALILFEPALIMKWEGHAFLLFSVQAWGLWYLFTRSPDLLNKFGQSSAKAGEFAKWFFSFLEKDILVSSIVLSVLAVLFYLGAFALRAKPKKTAKA